MGSMLNQSTRLSGALLDIMTAEFPIIISRQPIAKESCWWIDSCLVQCT